MKQTISRMFFAALFALAGAACAAAQVAAPKGFESTVAAETRGGVTLAAATETTTDAGRFVAAVYQLPESNEDDSGYQRLKVHFMARGGTAVRTFNLYTEAHVNLGTYEDEKTVFTDINKDTKTELIASVANGGNCWNCSQVLIYALDGGEVRALAAEPMTIADVTGDGVPDLLVGDTRWEGYGNFSHAGAPGGTMVYSWKDGRYVFAGSDAAAFYAKETARMEADLPEAIKAITPSEPQSDEMYTGTVICMYLVDVYMGRFDEGRALFAKRMAEHVASAEMEKQRKEVANDFLTGESAKELAEPRYSQPLEVPK